MKYKKYNQQYFEKVKHDNFTVKKKLAINFISKTRLFSKYYYQLIKIIKETPHNGKVLDIGCSHGGFLNFIHNLRPDLKLYGLDISDVGHLLPDFITFIQKDVINEKIEETGFDLIVSRHLIEHLNIQDVPIFFKKTFDLLKKEAIIFILCPILSNKFYDDPTHIRPYNKKSLYRLFEISDFKQIITYNGYEFNPPFNIMRNTMKLTWGFAKK